MINRYSTDKQNINVVPDLHIEMLCRLPALVASNIIFTILSHKPSNGCLVCVTFPFEAKTVIQ